jgi:hypothetical protein
VYELNRVRLVGIGPRGARYTDVTLDLSGVGAPVTPASLFESGARRPSPHSLLMLENGGGKSVLLKLVFSVVLPGRRRTVGGAALDKFVLDGDTGHVALDLDAGPDDAAGRRRGTPSPTRRLPRSARGSRTR